MSVFDTFNNLLDIYNVEHSYGGRTKQDENKEVKELFGNDNILKLGLDPEHSHISILVYTLPVMELLCTLMDCMMENIDF